MIEIRHTDDPISKYDQFYQGDKIRQMESFFIWICRLLKIKQGSRLIDISTGRGQMLVAANSFKATPFGLDFSMQACKIAADKQDKVIVVCANGEHTPFPSNCFDHVTVLGSLEHFNNMDRGVQEVSRLMSKNGTALFTVPNTFGLRWNVIAAWKTGDVADDGQPIQRYGTRNQWQRLFERNGLHVETVLGYEHELALPLTLYDLFDYLIHPRRLLRLLRVQLLPVNKAGQFVFICRSKYHN